MNWQQKELLSNSRGNTSSNRGGNYRGNSNNNNRAYYNNNNEQRGGGGWRDNRGEARNNDSNLPAWADGITNEPTAGTSGLNWQQQSLMQRDETDKFNHFVRGEDEFQRE